MQFLLFVAALIAVASAKCTNGIQGGSNNPCSYNVTCNHFGSEPTGGKAYETVTEKTLSDCLLACSLYANENDANCDAINYQPSTNACTLYSAKFATNPKKSGFISGVVAGCG